MTGMIITGYVAQTTVSKYWSTKRSVDKLYTGSFSWIGSEKGKGKEVIKIFPHYVSTNTSLSTELLLLLILLLLWKALTSHHWERRGMHWWHRAAPQSEHERLQHQDWTLIGWSDFRKGRLSRASSAPGSSPDRSPMRKRADESQGSHCLHEAKFKDFSRTTSIHFQGLNVDISSCHYPLRNTSLHVKLHAIKLKSH